MKKPMFLLTAVLLVIYLSLRATAAIKEPEVWPTYTPEGAGYSVQVPGTMTGEDQMIQLGDERWILQQGRMEWMEVAYTAAYGDLPEIFTSRPPEEILDRMVKATADPDYKLVHQEAFTLEGYPGVYGEYETPDGDKSLMKCCIRDQRLYRLIACIPRDKMESTRQHYEKFLNSLTFLRP